MTLMQIVVISSAMAALGPRSRRWPALLPLLALLAATACVLIDCRFNRSVLTFVGLPSLTSIAILVDYAVARAFGKGLLPPDDRRFLVRWLAVGSLLFYPSALGVIRFDVYRFGFSGAAPGVLAAIGVLLAARRRFGAAIVVLLALLALDVQLFPTVNAFDYVIDPIGGLIAIVWSTARVTKFVVRRFRTAKARPVEEGALEPA